MPLHSVKKGGEAEKLSYRERGNPPEEAFAFRGGFFPLGVIGVGLPARVLSPRASKGISTTSGDFCTTTTTGSPGLTHTPIALHLAAEK